jgi:CheY-like chemotaxis protein
MVSTWAINPDAPTLGHVSAASRPNEATDIALYGNKEIPSADGTPRLKYCWRLEVLCRRDPHPHCRRVARAGLRRVLKCQPGWGVVAKAANGKEAISKAIETTPNVAVLDYSMPRINGVEATRQIRARLPRTQVLIFTAYDDEKIIHEFERGGTRLLTEIGS